MPHFFFHVRTSAGVEKDTEGISFSSLQEARDDATTSLREMVSEGIAGGHATLLRGIDITDGRGKVMAKIDVGGLFDQ